MRCRSRAKRILVAAGREGIVRFPLCFAAGKERAVRLRDRPTRTLLAAGGSTGQCVFQAVQTTHCAQHPEKVRVRFKSALKRTMSPIDLPEKRVSGPLIHLPKRGLRPCDLHVWVCGPAKCHCDDPKHEFTSYCVF